MEYGYHKHDVLRNHDECDPKQWRNYVGDYDSVVVEDHTI
jgi:hypothetical protein